MDKLEERVLEERMIVSGLILKMHELTTEYASVHRSIKMPILELVDINVETPTDVILAWGWRIQNFEDHDLEES